MHFRRNTTTHRTQQLHRHPLHPELRVHNSHPQPSLPKTTKAKISTTQDMAEKLAQAIELTHSRDARHDEMLQKFELLMAHMTGSQGAQEATNPQSIQPHRTDPTTKGKTPPPTRSPFDTPPPKKINTNCTPEKQMYSIFQQPPAVHLPAPPPRTSRTLQFLTQPMETNADNNRPKPVAESGKKTE